MDTDRLTYAIIGCGMAVSSELGCGFLESVYRRALAHSLRKAGLQVESERAFRVLYGGVIVGDYRADLIVGDAVIVEVKALKVLTSAHHAQLLNYLKASCLPVGLILNFGNPRLEVRRMVN